MQGVNFSVDDKQRIAELLDEYGVDLIEGGWPGAIPKDTDFFLSNIGKFSNKLCAFGSTAKPHTQAKQDPQVQALLNSGASKVCIVAKSDKRHIEQALKTNEEENLRLLQDTISTIIQNNQSVYVDAEHFFDGAKYDELCAFRVVLESFKSGAHCVILCDTNGGCIPSEITEIIEKLKTYLSDNGIKLSDSKNSNEKIIGIHAHNDTGCAVANTLSAVLAGVAHIQGTFNEYGERTGNANIVSVICDLMLKMNMKTNIKLDRSFNIAHDIAEISNINLNSHFPYVGDVAFAHKAGLHASAIKISSDLYQHIDPKSVGNDLKMLISEMAGKSSIDLKATELGYDISANSEILKQLTSSIKNLEQQGYAFDAADASFELLLLDVLNKMPIYFSVESWRVISETKNENSSASEATVKITTGSHRVIATGEGNGPVNALDSALHSAIGDIYPEINEIILTDYRVRLLDISSGTDSVTRVLITCYDSKLNKSWSTVGVAENIVESSWKALVECYVYGLIQKGVKVKA